MRAEFARTEPTLGAWSVPWSDLMMVMFVLFVVLFALDVSRRRVTSSPEAPALAGRLNDVLQDARITHVDVVVQDDDSVKLSLRGPVFFDPGTAGLRPEAGELLLRLAPVLRRTEMPIEVVGHTDSTPIDTDRFPTNWELSAGRAASVARFLIDHGAVAPERFTVSGNAMYQPAVDDFAMGRNPLDRRVELVLRP